MKNIRIFLSENFHFLVVKFSVYLNRHVFVMCRCINVICPLGTMYIHVDLVSFDFLGVFESILISWEIESN